MPSKFTISKGFWEAPIEVSLEVDNITEEALLQFKPFKVWLETFEKSFAIQSERGHPFHSRKERYSLKEIKIQSVDWFGPRIGFVKMQTVVKNEADGFTLPGVVFLRGGSVAILMILKPEGAGDEERFVVMTQQPRVPVGSLTFYEIPAGMIDDEGTFKGAAAKELFEETGLKVPASELKDMTALALQDAKGSEPHLQKAMYPSPGGCDEYIALFLWERTMRRNHINDLREKLGGTEREKIRVKLVKYEELWREGARDAKTLAALALYEGLTRDGKLT